MADYDVFGQPNVIEDGARPENEGGDREDGAGEDGAGEGRVQHPAGG